MAIVSVSGPPSLLPQLDSVDEIQVVSYEWRELPNGDTQLWILAPEGAVPALVALGFTATVEVTDAAWDDRMAAFDIDDGGGIA